MELFQLRYFVAAARSLHFSQAAEEVGVSQPSLSLQIAKLERELGAALFTRQGRSVKLTDAGEALLIHAERMLELETEAHYAVQQVTGLKSGRLSIWSLPTPGQYILPPILAQFKERYPEIQLNVREEIPAQAIAEAVESERADIGIAQTPYQAEGLARKVLIEEELALVVPEDHPLTRQEYVPLQAAAEEDFVWVQEGRTVSHPLYAACLAHGFAPKIAYVSGSPQGMQALVAAKLGITLLPKMAIHPPKGAVMIELAEPRPTRTVIALWRPGALSHAASAFLQMLD